MKYPNDWHLLSREQVLHDLDVDLYKGLSEKEVRQRRRQTGPNTIWHVPRTSAADVMLAALFDLSSVLLVISAAAAALFDKSREALVLVLVLLLGGVLRTITYVRANRILEERAWEKIPAASVMREGKVCLMSARDIVPGDIIFLETGDTVPCDGRVVAGGDAVVSERGITENKVAVHKFDSVMETEAACGEVPCEYRSNMLFAGSTILSGSVRIAATACGEASLIWRKQGGICLEAAERLPILEKLRLRSKTVSLFTLACVMFLTVLALFFREHASLPDVFLGTMSMAVAAMSEFLTIIGTIMIAVEIRSAADPPDPESSRVVIRKPENLEQLRDVQRIVLCGSSFLKSGRSGLYAYHVQGDYKQLKSGTADPDLDDMLSLAMAASADKQTGLSAGGTSPFGRTSELHTTILRAVRSYTEKTDSGLSAFYPLYDHRGAEDPQTQGMEVSLIAKNGDTWITAAGAIDAVLRCCTNMQTSAGTVPLTDDLCRTIYTECARLTFSGAQVAAVAMRPSPYRQLNRLSMLTQYMTFVGFFAVSEEPQTNVKEQLAYLHKIHTSVILFTEKPDADLYYCHRIGLFNKKTIRVRAEDLTRDLVDAVSPDGMIVSFEETDSSHLAAAASDAMKCIMHTPSADMEHTAQEDDSAIPVTAAVGRETWDSHVLSQADVSIAAARSDLRTIPETLSRFSSVLLFKNRKQQNLRTSEDAGFGGMDGVVHSIRLACGISARLDAAKSYLTMAQTARLLVLLGAVLLDIPLIQAVFILIWGLLFDFSAVLMMALEKIREERLPAGWKQEILSVLFGFLWGSVLIGFLPFLRWSFTWLPCTLYAGEELALLCGSIILSGAVLACLRLRFGQWEEKRRYQMHTAGTLFLLGAVLLVLLLTQTNINCLGSTFCGWKAVFTLLPSAVLWIAAETLYGCLRLRKKHLAAKTAQTENAV